MRRVVAITATVAAAAAAWAWWESTRPVRWADGWLR